MFISEQYGWNKELSGDYFDAMLDIGCGHYHLTAYIGIDELRDVDMMLIGL